MSYVGTLDGANIEILERGAFQHREFIDEDRSAQHDETPGRPVDTRDRPFGIVDEAGARTLVTPDSGRLYNADSSGPGNFGGCNEPEEGWAGPQATWATSDWSETALQSAARFQGLSNWAAGSPVAGSRMWRVSLVRTATAGFFSMEAGSGMIVE